MSTLQLCDGRAVIGGVLSFAELYQLRPNAPRLPEGIVVLRYDPARGAVVSDGVTQRQYNGDLTPFSVLLADEQALAAELAALRTPSPPADPDPALYRRAGAARQFRNALRINPLDALVQQAKENSR